MSVVVGGSGGIGSEVIAALRAATRGAIVNVDRVANADVQVDLADHREGSGFRRWLDAVSDDPPDLIAWCAGVYDRRSAVEYTPARIAEVLGTNLSAFLLFGSVLAAAQERDGRRRRLVVVGSQAGVTGGTDLVYAASKAGLVAAVKSLSREYSALGLRANIVSPGPTETPMAAVMNGRRAHYEATIPVGRFNTATEVAAVVVWLLTGAPDTISGASIDVDGGLVRR